MPDMRTAIEEAITKSKEKLTPNEELRDALDQWENERGAMENGEQVPAEPEAKKNLSRTIHAFIVANPRCVFSDIVHHVSQEGFGISSVSSLLSQMINSELIERSVDRKYTSKKEYSPVGNVYKKNLLKRKQEAKKIARQAKKEMQAGLASLSTSSLSVPVAPAQFDPDAMLANLSFPQVMALYKKIKLMIGEV